MCVSTHSIAMQFEGTSHSTLFLLCSQQWYGPATKRYQVSAGMSLSTPPWVRSKKDKKDGKVNLDDATQSIPSAPPAHLTAKNITYEVDVPIDESTSDDIISTNDGKGAKLPETIQVTPDSEFDEIPRTARDYGQRGKGAATEWMIRRRLGDSALSASSESSSSSFSPLGSANNISASAMTTTLEDGSVVVDLEPPEPGRLRLLSGITCSFRPSTMTALMGYV